MKKQNIAAILFAASTLLSSCGGAAPDIPEDKCAEIIFQMHKADAIILIKGFNDKSLNNDSLSYYNEVFAKEGITRQQFIETIDWYVRHPEKYKSLYDLVIKKVAQFEQDEKLRIENKKEKDPNDVWNMKRDWNLPLDGETNPIAFNIETDKNGTYTLTCDVTYYEDDMSENPRTTIIVEYDDGTTDENSIFNEAKDGKEHQVKLILTTNKDKKVKLLRGWVLDHSDNTKKKHIDCYNIQIKYTNE
jgi:hypothetical protein